MAVSSACFLSRKENVRSGDHLLLRKLIRMFVVVFFHFFFARLLDVFGDHIDQLADFRVVSDLLLDSFDVDSG